MSRKRDTSPARCLDCRDEDPRARFPPFLCGACEAKHFGRREPFAYELTPAGEQAVIPGAERKPAPRKPTQLSLWG